MDGFLEEALNIMQKYKYDKNSLKENLSIEEVFDLVAELGGEPHMNIDSFTARTICHGGNSHKLYYYANTHLFHCYTECGDASFDIYELVLKVGKASGRVNYSLPQAIVFVAKYFGYSTDNFEFEDCQEDLEDWKFINAFKRGKEKSKPQQVELKVYDNAILKYLPCPRILPWEKEDITLEILKARGICYDPLNMGIVIPHYDINNNLIGIRERTLIKEEEVYGKYKPAILNGKQFNHPLSFNVYNLNFSKNNIQKMQKIIIFEGEKSCLKYASYFGKENDITGAVCGSNLLNYQFSLIYGLGVKEIIIAFDKQYKQIGDDEYKRWVNKLKTISYKYSNFCNISFIFDTHNLLNYKDAPIDQGKDIFLQLFKERLDSNGQQYN